ncbi:dTDP-4-dehydrorhamnose reductase [Zhouia amylolytica]|uniref:dTDP-4-dehydrorhamnose reductase n=1 Tax=Zhouia amylolytica TaxID=376730 RepID=A0A1I6T1N8_9FLAO|nr:sugar nucleotide-binding protein [Zhouia amylolytica]MCQ0112670.1 sugar nucleotide-binding protein [Zhouia amylolytica]SFS83115.1 dTDP-4-dehydrorhamnose reductase [Zhouia amylolytica]
MKKKKSTRILILGASGFLGQALYKELCHYYDTYGTYHTGRIYSDNKHYFHFDIEHDDIYDVLEKVKPQVIVSALRGDFEALIETHEDITDYIRLTKCKIFFFSSANVFDAFSNYPSYEYDKTLSLSKYGRLKIKIENMLMRLPENKYVIARLPMVFGSTSPRVKELKSSIQQKEPYEVFPDLIMNVASVDNITRQIHYMINRKRKGIYHLGSYDLVHHDEFVKEMIEKHGYGNVIYKNVYTSNFDRYLAVLPKDNKLPNYLQYSYNDVIDEYKSI